jgi:HNH endonuclease/EVE domain
MAFWIGIDTPEIFAISERKNNPNGPRPYGFPAGRRRSVERMQVGDRIINYMKGDKVFFAVWKITEPYEHKPDYTLGGQKFPECVTVIPEVLLPPKEGVSFDRIKDRLKAFPGVNSSKRLSTFVRQSARLLTDGDGQAILNALREEEKYNLESRSSEAEQEIDRRKKLAEHARRPGQQKFSAMLRRNYQSTCTITGCRTSAVLEAAHIRVQKDIDDNSPENGLLLRSDIHALFDAHLITLREDGARVEVSSELSDQSYAFLRHATVLPPIEGACPSPGNIRGHRSHFKKRLSNWRKKSRRRPLIA